MGWQLTGDLSLFTERVLPMLRSDPIENTVALTVLANLAAGRHYSDIEPLFGWWPEQGEPRGAVLMTPPWELLLIRLPAESVGELVDALAGIDLPGVNGTPESVERLAAAWTQRRSVSTTEVMRQRLYRLDGLRTPVPPSGQARRAGAADGELVLAWVGEFQQESFGQIRPGVTELAGRALEQEPVWLWADPEPVSLAGRTETVAGTARIGPVYTPPAHRRRGYGVAVTAACTQDAIDLGAEHVVLFTDMANPTSNSIYRAIGYVATSDRQVVRFGPRRG